MSADNTLSLLSLSFTSIAGYYKTLIFWVNGQCFVLCELWSLWSLHSESPNISSNESRYCLVSLYTVLNFVSHGEKTPIVTDQWTDHSWRKQKLIELLAKHPFHGSLSNKTKSSHPHTPNHHLLPPYRLLKKLRCWILR